MSSSKSWGGSGIFEIRFATIVLVFEFSKAEKQCSKARQLERGATAGAAWGRAAAHGGERAKVREDDLLHEAKLLLQSLRL